MSIASILELDCVNKNEVIDELLDKLEAASFDINTYREQLQETRTTHRLVMQKLQSDHAQELQRHMEKHAEHLAQINQIDTDMADAKIQVKCKSCEGYYDLPCDVSEFKADMSYCGGSPRCCP